MLGSLIWMLTFLLFIFLYFATFEIKILGISFQIPLCFQNNEHAAINYSCLLLYVKVQIECRRLFLRWTMGVFHT